jgi:hypothetical protein
MTSTPPLSAEQKKAKEIYMAAFVPAMLVATVSFGLLVGIVQFLLHLLFDYRGYVNFGWAFFILWFGANWWAVRQVRRSGLSQELTTTETIPKTATQFSSQSAEWMYPKTMMGALGIASIYFIFSAFGWWLWHFTTGVFKPFIGMVGFWLFLLVGVVGLIYLRAPYVGIDDKGVVGFQNLWWRRRAPWDKIATVELKRCSNYSGESTARWFIFRDEKGKMLLNLTPFSLQGLSGEEIGAIEVEIKRSMKG